MNEFYTDRIGKNTFLKSSRGKFQNDCLRELDDKMPGHTLYTYKLVFQNVGQDG